MASLQSIDELFISKLNGVLENNYHQERFGVSELAESLGVSRSKLHRKLSEIKGVSASQYIKCFRLEKGYALLKSNSSTVSEVAYSVGFSSPSYFTKCFHKRYKCSPIEVKHKPELEVNIEEHPGMPGQASLWSFKKGIFLGVLVVLFGAGTYLVGYIVPDNEGLKQVTLAVLPFKTLSSNPSDKYFSDGVMDVILSNLSKIEGIHVISRTTMEQYRETSKTIPEITKELGISHILEASVQKQTDKVRIVVQLIDAKHDVHIWSDDYERHYDDIFSMQSDIAKKVVEQLELTLSPTDDKKITESPTKNFEAYNLYLKGRYFLDRRTEADLKWSVKYFEEAIALDSLYAIAYAGLGASYITLAGRGWYPREEGFQKGKMYSEKALAIDENISLAYTVLGAGYYWHDWDWKQAENKLQQSIYIDPSNETAHYFYAELLNVLGRNKEAREHINLAKKFSPISQLIYKTSNIIYYNNHEFEKAIEDSEKVIELGGVSFHNRFDIYVKQHKYDKAIEVLKVRCSIFNEDPEIVDKIYEASGIEGAIKWFIDRTLGSQPNGYYDKARLCMLIGDIKSALDLLEKSYEFRNLNFPRIKHDIIFQPLKSEPRFKALVDKLNME
ncbi:helix-turn-helix domain-containing protein [Aestuariibaculum sediminum]|uniref:Helix-turn-helix domain-containing protein n=1 Tax=Aestuariibaculum sediminum TaxID=2770637 RepID=A0A8J6UBJ2_9FLAO|nr:helix-turn-helix domain-containing protein [Aestuariibaculum sediminum]MBD0830894.1 helix-turn-helix domain-containing protein [Aestuariibaculum sediminum]